MEEYKFTFLQRQVVDISILKMISPSKFLVKEVPGIHGSEEAKAFNELEEAMDMYYKTYHIEIGELPCCDSVVAVSSDGNNWYRAKVESILETTTGPRVIAYLLDYGKTMSVEKFCVRKPFPRFYDVPFQALEFQLYGIVPCSLIMQPDCTMAYGRVNQWDVAAKTFVETIVSSERCAQMKVVHIDCIGVLHGDLLVSIDGQLTPLSKELISYKYAVPVSNIETMHRSDGEEIVCSVENKDQYSVRNFKDRHRKLFKRNSNLLHDQGRKIQGTVDIENCGVKHVSSVQAALSKLKFHQKNQDLSHQTSDQKKVCRTTSGFSANEGNCTIETSGELKISDSEISTERWSSDSVSAKNESFSNTGKKTISRIEKLLSVVQKRSEGTVSHLPSSCNPVGDQLLEACQDKTNSVLTGNSARTLTQYDKFRFLTNRTSSVAQTSSACGKEERFENDSRSTTVTTLDHPVVSTSQAENKTVSPKVHISTQGKSKHLEFILQRSLRKPLQEFQSVSARIRQVKENKLDYSNTDVYQNKKKSVGLSQKIPTADSSEAAPFPKFKSYLSSHKSCKDNRIEIHSNSNQLRSNSCAENHVFMKLSKLNESTKETSDTGKHAPVKRENYEVNSGGYEFNLKKDKEGARDVLPKFLLPCTATSKTADSESNFSSEVDTSLADATDKIQVRNALENDINHKDQTAYPDSAMISPVRKPVNAHFKTALDKWEGMLWDNNKLLQIICHGKGEPKPITAITSAGFNTSILEGLKEMHFPGPLPLQTRMWPSVLRGRNIVSVAPPKSGKTFGYLLPLLSLISEPIFYEGLPSSGGPLALILCSSWNQAQNLHDHCRIILDKCNQIKVMVVYGGGCEELQKVQLVNGCDVLIATPSSLLRLLWNDEYKIIDLKRCCHLIIDDGDTVLELFREEILKILKEYGCSLQNRKHLAVPNQIIVCCEHWKRGISSFAQYCMPDSLILITSPFEAAVHACVFTYCHFVSKPQCYSAIVNIIDSCNGKRVVICTTDDVDARNIHQFLNHMSIYSILILSSMLHYEVNSLISEWKLSLSPDTVHILILTDDVLIDAGVTNADCLIQCNLESTSYSDFVLRYGCMKENYYLPKEQNKNGAKCTCHLLLTDDCINIAPTLVNMLQELPLKIPQKLHSIAEERIKQLEASKSDLCYYLKAYGHCPNKSTCRERHTMSKELAHTELPKYGKVRVLVCFVIDATHYYARIIEHNDLSSNCMLSPSSYLDINLKLTEYYRIKDNCVVEDEIKVGKICVIERTGSTYHRVRIEKIVHYNCFGKPRRVKLHYLDEGWQEVDDAQKLLKMSSNLASYPVQVVEVYLCQVQPIDKCYEWSPQASTSVHNMIGGKEMTGKIVLTLGCTMWLDPFVHYVQVDKTGIVIKEPNVRVALIKQGFAMANNTHIENLYAVCSGIVPLPLMINQETKPVQNSNVQYAFLELNKNHCVYVFAVQNPDMFFIQRNDRADLIDNLQKEIQELHKKSKLKKLENVQKGLFCIAPFSNHDYYRARIEEVHNCESGEESDIEVSLFFVDFGDKGVAKKSDLYFIPEQFLLLPFQAVECSLGGISAPQSGWTENICDMFDSLTIITDDVRKQLLLKVLRKEPSHFTGGHHYVVKLWEEGSESHTLSDVLVRQGMAIATNLQDFSENTDDALSSDHNLSDEETKMELAFYTKILKNSLARIIPKKKKITSNKVQCVTSNTSDSSQKLEVESVPPLEKCTVGYTIPQILWWQKKGFVKISVCLVGVDNCETIFRERYILFATTLNGTKYRFEQDLFESIDSEKSKKTITGQYVELTLVKLKEGIKWPRLTASSRKKPYIRVNFDYLDCSSSDEEPSKVVKANPEEIAHFEEPSDEEYSSEEDEAWTEAHFKDNFYSF